MSTQGDEIEEAPSSVVTYVLLSIAIAIFIYILITQIFGFGKDHWSKYGIKQCNMSVFDADFRGQFQKILTENGDTVGIRSDVIVTKDLEILKSVMIKDFNNFVDRKQNFLSNSPLASSVFFVTGAAWRRLRHITTPSFTTGKLKLISNTVDESAEKLADFCLSCAKSGRLFPVKKTTAQYTSEIIARTAFGFKTDCIGGEDDEFTNFSKGIIKSPSSFLICCRLIMEMIPGLSKFVIKVLKINAFDSVDTDSNTYFCSLIKKAIPYRRELELSGGRKPADFLQMIVAAQQSAGGAAAENSLTDDEIIGQSMLLIFAGFETTATTLQMILYNLAQHPDVQENVFEEIESVVKSSKPTHEEIGELTYMEQVIDETMRLYPPLPFLSRKAEESRVYGDITFPAGTMIVIPIYNILRDPKLWPDPEKFDPERFTEEAKQARNPLAFMPFGQGPRVCIGLRLAYLEMKIGLVHMLRKVKFELSDVTEPKKGEESKFGHQSFVTPLKPIQLLCTPRE